MDEAEESIFGQTLPGNGGKPMPIDRLWIVVAGSQTADEAIARELATKVGVGAVMAARAKIDQSYEPRMISAK